MKQSLRTKNRIREHANHGWRIIDNSPHMSFDGVFVGEAVLLDCPCGWTGWIPKKELS